MTLPIWPPCSQKGSFPKVRLTCELCLQLRTSSTAPNNISFYTRDTIITKTYGDLTPNKASKLLRANLLRFVACGKPSPLVRRAPDFTCPAAHIFNSSGCSPPSLRVAVTSIHSPFIPLPRPGFLTQTWISTTAWCPLFSDIRPYGHIEIRSTNCRR